MSYFQAVRLYSLVEVCIFASLLVVAIGGLGESAERALGWTHGVGWIVLCLLVAYGCRRKVFWARLGRRCRHSACGENGRNRVSRSATAAG